MSEFLPTRRPSVYGAVIPMIVTRDDKAAEVRKMARAAGESVAKGIMQTWLANPGDYNVDIAVTMEERL